MKRIFTQLIAISATLLVSATSSAGMITDTVYQQKKLNEGDKHIYWHDLNDNPGWSAGTAVHGKIEIDLWQDKNFLGLPDLASEKAVIKFDGIYSGTVQTNIFDWIFEDYTSSIDVSMLNDDGKLKVGIKAVNDDKWWNHNDFWVGKSVLTVWTRDVVNAVPEPATTALLAFGVAALILGRRSVRKQDQQKA